MASVNLLSSASFKSHLFKATANGPIFKFGAFDSTLTVNGSPVLDTDDFCLYNASVILDGTDDYYDKTGILGTLNINGSNKQDATNRTIIFKLNTSSLNGFYGLYSLFVDNDNYESLLIEVYTSGTKQARYRYKLVSGGVVVYDLTSASLGALSTLTSWILCNINISDQIPYINGVSFAGSATVANFLVGSFNLGRAYLDGQYYYYNNKIDTCLIGQGLLYNRNYTVAVLPEYNIEILETQILHDAVSPTTNFIYPRVIPQNRGEFFTNNIDAITVGNNLWAMGWQEIVGGSNYGIFFDFQIPNTFTLTLGGGGSLTVGQPYYYKITALDTESGIESILSEGKTLTPTVGNQTVTLNNIFNTRNITLRSSTAHLVKRIYRSTNNADFKYIATIAWNTISYVDNGSANTNGHNYVPSNFIGIVAHSLTTPSIPTTGMLFAGPLTGSFAYIATNYDPLTGIESPCSLESVTVNPSSQTVPVNYSGGLGNGYTLRLYRRNIGTGSTFWYLLTELSNVTAGVFNDNVIEANLSSVRIVNRTLLNFNSFPYRDILSYHLDRVWIAFGNRIYFSEIGKYGLVNHNSYIDILDGEGPILALYSFLNNLLIFKEKSVFILTGDSVSTFRILKISRDTSIGCSSKWTLKEIQNRLLFANSLGVYIFNGSTFDILTDSIKDIFNNELKQQQRGVLTSALDNENKYYLLGLRLSTFEEAELIPPRVNCNIENDTILMFDIEAYINENKKIWYKWTENTLYLTDGVYLFNKPSSVIISYDNNISVLEGSKNGGNTNINIFYSYESNPLTINPYQTNRFDHLKVTLDVSEFTSTKTINVGFIVNNTLTNTPFTVLTQEDLEIKPSTRAKFIKAKVTGSTNEKLIITGLKINAEVTGFR